MSEKVTLSICIVAFKAYKELNATLHSLQKNPPSASFEVIVVDHSGDQSQVPAILEKYKNFRVHYIKPVENRGYGAGNNIAIAAAQGKYCVVLNPDVVLEKNTIDILLKTIQKKKVAIVAPAFAKKTKKDVVALGAGDLTPLRGIFALSFLNKLFPNNRFSKQYYLTDKNRKEERRVTAVAGSIFITQTSIFREIGGFDEKLFLYFEENDLGRRLVKKGHSIWITPDAQVFHAVGKTTDSLGDKRRKQIFAQSRFYYFKKHFGLLQALLVEAFARFGKYEALAILVICLGAFLRFFRIEENLVFHGELGHNYLAMKDIVETGVIPLIGPPTSHQWLWFGPLYYWIFTPILVFMRYSPVGMAYIFAFLHSVLLVLNFIAVKRVFSKQLAISTTVIMALSPVFLYLTRESRFFSLTLLLFYPFFMSFVKGKYFLAGILFAVLLNFHLTPLVYVPAILLFLFLKRRATFFPAVKRFVFGSILGLTPILLYSLSDKGQMVISSVAWVPYRVAGFLGFYDKNTVSVLGVEATIRSIATFFKSIFVPSDNTSLLPFAAALIFFVLIGYLVKKVRLVDEKHFFLQLIVVCGLVALAIHGNPPDHYFLPLLVPIVTLISAYVLDAKLQLKVVFAVLFIIFIAINSQYYFSSKWFFSSQTEYRSGKPVPYGLQLEVAGVIKQDASDMPFSLRRIGPYDEFAEDFSQNYKYLLSRKKAMPENGKYLVYTVYEGVSPYEPSTIIFSKGSLSITRTYDTENPSN